MLTGQGRALGALLFLLPALVGGKCGGGDGSGGSALVVEQKSSDARCAPLADIRGFPPGYDFVPEPAAGPAPLRVLAATATQSNLIPLGIEQIPFQLPPGSVNYLLPPDSDGDGNIEFFKSIDDVNVESADLALVTVSGNVEAVLFIEPGTVDARQAEVSVPPGFDPAWFAAFPGLPAPGSSRMQTGITTTVCVDAGPGAVDSRGDLLVDAIPSLFWCDGPGSFPASFTSGAAIIGDRLFATTSNVGLDPGSQDTQFLPATVAVYDIDTAADPIAVSPSAATVDGRPYIVTSGFNATHVTPYTTPSGRRFALVTLSGAVGIRADDPNTDEIESGALPITDGAIDVIDVDAGELVATIPLEDANPAFDGIALDPSGRLGLMGDLNARHLYGIDLAVLDALGPPGSGGPPVELGNAVVFDGLNPLLVPALPGGAPASTCPGQVSGVGFQQRGRAAYVLESCDGTVTAFDVDLSGDPTLAELRTRVVYSSTSPATAPLRADTVDQLRRPTSLKVRPGRPGIDYQGPDVFFLITDPESLLCGVRIDSP
jgi:hypothetical protein